MFDQLFACLDQGMNDKSSPQSIKFDFLSGVKTDRTDTTGKHQYFQYG